MKDITIGELMPKADLFIKSAFISTRNKLDDRELVCGKIEKNSDPEIFLFYLIEVNNSENSQLTKKITGALENYLENNPELNTDHFEHLLIHVNQSLSQLTRSGENKWLGRLNALIGLSYKAEISISSSGNIRGYIFRKGKISTITDNQNNIENHPLKTFADITSGKFSKDDLIVFGNKDLFDFISFDKLKNLNRENFYKETHDLSRFLKKFNAQTANAIIIKTTDQIDHDQTPENGIFFTDDPEETILHNLAKKIDPLFVHLKKNIVSLFGITYSKLKKLLSASKKNIDQKIAPQTLELVQKGKSSLKNITLHGHDNAKPQLERLREKDEFKSFRVKKFSDKKDTNNLEILKNAKALLLNLRFINIKDKKKYFYIFVIVLFLIIGYVKIKANNEKRTDSVRKVEIANYLNQAVEKFNKTKDDLALGKTISLDGYYEALSLAQKAEGSSNKDQATKLIKQINTILDEKEKRVRINPGSPMLLADKIKGLNIAGTEIYGFQPDGKLYMVDIRDRDPKLVASLDSNFGNPEKAYYSESLNKLIVSTNTNKLLAYDIESRSFSEIKLSDETSTWPRPNSIATYSTNIYLLDAANDKVLKYSANDGKYSSGKNYVDTKKVSLKNAIDGAVDGNLFILFSDGSVKKFVRGSLEPDFAVRGIPSLTNNIGEPARLFTDENTNSIFVLDKKSNRILKFDKSGDFINQYVFDNINIDDFIVNAKLQKIWALSAGKIYEGNL